MHLLVPVLFWGVTMLEDSLVLAFIDPIHGCRRGKIYCQYYDMWKHRSLSKWFGLVLSIWQFHSCSGCNIFETLVFGKPWGFYVLFFFLKSLNIFFYHHCCNHKSDWNWRRRGSGWKKEEFGKGLIQASLLPAFKKTISEINRKLEINAK